MTIRVRGRILAISLKRYWSWPYWCNEAGGAALQVGPLIVEFLYGDVGR